MNEAKVQRLQGSCAKWKLSDLSLLRIYNKVSLYLYFLTTISTTRLSSTIEIFQLNELYLISSVTN